MLFVATSLRQLRERRSLSQEELADLAGLSRTTINKLENGTQKPRPKTVRQLARALRVDLADLLASRDTHAT